MSSWQGATPRRPEWGPVSVSPVRRGQRGCEVRLKGGSDNLSRHSDHARVAVEVIDQGFQALDHVDGIQSLRQRITVIRR